MVWLVLLAILAGVWRVVDGRGQEWLPFPTPLRNVITIALATITAFLALGPTPWMFWFAGIASLALITGLTKWESYAVMVPRYGLPPLVACAVPAYWIDMGPGTALGFTIAGVVWVLSGVTVGLIYPTAARWPQFFPGPLRYLPEFSAGAAMIGGIGLLSGVGLT